MGLQLRQEAFGTGAAPIRTPIPGWEREIMGCGIGKHSKFVAHGIAWEIHRLNFKGAPVERLPRWVEEHIVDAPDDISATVILRVGIRRFQAVEESDFRQHNGL